MNLTKLHSTGRPKLLPPLPRGPARPWRGPRLSLAEEIDALDETRIGALCASRYPLLDCCETKRRFAAWVGEQKKPRRDWVTWLDAWLDFRAEVLEPRRENYSDTPTA